MRYINSYKLFESVDINNIRECFLSVLDMTHVKIGRLSNNDISISIGLSHRIDTSESGQTKWGVKYKELINGDLISEEIANSISICMGMGFEIKRAEVSWVNAGEWKLSNTDKEGTGPGILMKIFEEGGIIGPMDMIDQKVSRARYSPDILSDFIVDKGSRLRHITIIFKSKK
jgi:hypothetical protein